MSYDTWLESPYNVEDRDDRPMWKVSLPTRYESERYGAVAVVEFTTVEEGPAILYMVQEWDEETFAAFRDQIKEEEWLRDR